MPLMMSITPTTPKLLEENYHGDNDTKQRHCYGDDNDEEDYQNDDDHYAYDEHHDEDDDGNEC